MALRHPGQKKTLFLLVSAVFITLLMSMLGYTKWKSFSYSKLAPLSLELNLVSELEQSLALDYDYGYGFNADHSQMTLLPASSKPQLVRFSISSWKNIKQLRIRKTKQQQLVLNSVSLQRAGSMVRMLGVSRSDPAQQIVFQLDNVASVFESEGDANAGD